MYDVNIMSILREEIDISSTFQNTQISSINMAYLFNLKTRHPIIDKFLLYTGYINYLKKKRRTHTNKQKKKKKNEEKKCVPLEPQP